MNTGDGQHAIDSPSSATARSYTVNEQGNNGEEGRGQGLAPGTRAPTIENPVIESGVVEPTRHLSGRSR